MKYIVKRITRPEFIPQIVAIHQESFANFFMTELGTRFLTIYYQSVMKHDEGILLGCYENDNLLGFCAATCLSKGFNQRLVKFFWWKYLVVSSYLLFFKTKSLLRLVKNLTKKNPEIQDNGNYAELLSIATAINNQGKGVGQQLLTGLEKELKEKNCIKISLTTDFYDNDHTIGFYKKMEYSILYEFIAYPNRKMYRLVKDI